MGLKLNNNRAMLKSLEKGVSRTTSPQHPGLVGKRSNHSLTNGKITNERSNDSVPTGLTTATMSSSVPNPMNYFATDGNTNSVGPNPAGAPFYQNLLPKFPNDYNAMNAALINSFANPFYNMALDPRIHPYSIQRLLELTAAGQQQHLQQHREQQEEQVEDMIEEVTEEELPDEPKLVMDLDESDAKELDEGSEKNNEENGCTLEVEESQKVKNISEMEEHYGPNDQISPRKSEETLTIPENIEQQEMETAEINASAHIKKELSRPGTPEKVEQPLKAEQELLTSTPIKMEINNIEGDEEDDEEQETEDQINKNDVHKEEDHSQQVDAENCQSPRNEETSTELRCRRCQKQFNHPTELVQHEKVLCGFIKQELEHHYHQQQQLRLNESLIVTEPTNNSSSFLQSSDAEDDPEDHDSSKNDCSSESGERKVRVRTAITEEQQNLLKQHYAINARPSRDEFRMIATRLQLDARVVQVWFQNNRSRERKMQSYSNNVNNCNNNKIAFPSIPQQQSIELSLSNTQQVHTALKSSTEDQPLDLTVRKGSNSPILNLLHSPLYGVAPLEVASDSADHNEAINLSRKAVSSPSLSPSSASSMPAPFKQQTAVNVALYFGHPPNGQHFRQSPSQNEGAPTIPRPGTSLHRNGNFSAVSLGGQLPPYMLPSAAAHRNLVPMEALFQMNPEYARGNPLINSIKVGCAGVIGDYRGTSLSPGGSEKRSWRDDESRISHEDDYANATASLLAPKPRRVKAETHGHAGDPDLPFVCDQCDKAFAKQSSLARHKYEHSGKLQIQKLKW